MKETIEVPIYYMENDDGDKIVDEESIEEEFNRKLKEIVKNPKRYLK